jgi:hypothetical protein
MVQKNASVRHSWHIECDTNYKILLRDIKFKPGTHSYVYFVSVVKTVLHSIMYIISLVLCLSVYGFFICQILIYEAITFADPLQRTEHYEASEMQH